MNNYDIGRMGRHTQNILKWNKNDIKSTRMTTGDYFIAPRRHGHVNSCEKMMQLPSVIKLDASCLFSLRGFYFWSITNTISDYFLHEKLFTFGAVWHTMTISPPTPSLPVLSCALLLVFSGLKYLILVTQSPKYTRLKRIINPFSFVYAVVKSLYSF